MNWLPKILYVDMETGQNKGVQFEFPPSGDPFRETIDHDVKKTVSNNGSRQYQYNWGREIIEIEFQFQSETVKNAFYYFLNNHGVKGGYFDYYSSSDLPEHKTYQLDIDSVKFERIIPSSIPGEFYYNFGFKMSRIIS